MDPKGCYGFKYEYNGHHPFGHQLCETINTINQLTYKGQLTSGRNSSSHAVQILAEIERQAGDQSFFELVNEIRRNTGPFGNSQYEQEMLLGRQWITDNSIRNIAKQDAKFMYKGPNNDVRSLQAATFVLNDALNDDRQMFLNLVPEQDASYQHHAWMCADIEAEGNALCERLSAVSATLTPEESRIVREWKFATPFQRLYDVKDPEGTMDTVWSKALSNITSELNNLSKSSSHWNDGRTLNAPHQIDTANSQNVAEIISIGNSISTQILKRDNYTLSEHLAIESWQDIVTEGIAF